MNAEFLTATLPDSFLYGAKGAPAKSDGTRFIVQISINGGSWSAYVPKGRRRSGHTLTSAEAFAYMATLPTMIKVYENEETINKGAQYRVIESTCTDGLISQKVVTA